MASQQARLALEGRHDRLVIGADFWGDVVSWAIAQGWICESLDEELRWDHGHEFSSQDAARLADALDTIGGDLVLRSRTDVSEDFIAELADALLTLQKFAESGGFLVKPIE